ncbi:MAG: tRNA guanosine(34) transglycosylase Tgt [Chloroflexota bacterium]
MNFFELKYKSPEGKARAGLLRTEHGEIPTPAFMPVGTQGSVKAVRQSDLESLGAKIILGNTYHLYLRPNPLTLETFGGLHKFMNWNGAILTDSGGYQIFSLQELRKITMDGVHFKSHIDGSNHYFTPENVVEIQRSIGSDIMMVLDECVPYPAEADYAAKSMKISLNWAARSRKHFNATDPIYGFRQYQFGIGQGGMYKDLRKAYIEEMINIGFDGYAIGGLSVGEPTELMYELTDYCTDYMLEDKPRYLMGVGTPENILEGIERGIDMFDCVMPTRNARNGQLFTTRGKINIKNAKYKLSDEPIDEAIDCYASRNFSLGYLRHLITSGEILGLELASQHNVAFYLWLARTAREKILEGSFRQWKLEFLDRFNTIS